MFVTATKEPGIVQYPEPIEYILHEDSF